MVEEKSNTIPPPAAEAGAEPRAADGAAPVAPEAKVGAESDADRRAKRDRSPSGDGAPRRSRKRGGRKNRRGNGGEAPRAPPEQERRGDRDRERRGDRDDRDDRDRRSFGDREPGRADRGGEAARYDGRGSAAEDRGRYGADRPHEEYRGDHEYRRGYDYEDAPRNPYGREERRDWPGRREDRRDWPERREDRREWSDRREDRREWPDRREWLDRREWPEPREDRRDWPERREDRRDWPERREDRREWPERREERREWPERRERAAPRRPDVRPVVELSRVPRDALLGDVEDDPRTRNGESVKQERRRSNGMNSESFDPRSTLVRPDMRVIVGPKREALGRSLRHDDLVVVPEFFCAEDDWSMYYGLVEEMRALQRSGEEKSEWISWQEGCHLITKAPEGSKTFQKILEKVAKYYNLRPGNRGVRFNWYQDSLDWKPLHWDSAAFDRRRAQQQNITIGVSFGRTRELVFKHAKNGTLVYLPNTNGMMYSFGRDTNILWKHGINALPPEEQDGKGRISIIMWGWVQDTVEEENSPPMIQNNKRGKAGKGRR